MWPYENEPVDAKELHMEDDAVQYKYFKSVLQVEWSKRYVKWNDTSIDCLQQIYDCITVGQNTSDIRASMKCPENPIITVCKRNLSQNDHS